MRKLLMGLLALMLPLSAHAGHEDVALTFDDLPSLTILNNQPYVNYSNEIILRGLKAHDFPAIGFVNEGKFDDIIRSEQIEILHKWLKAGMQLGNHTYSHESPDQLTADQYIADIARGEKVTRPLLAEHHMALAWFRHPYLETGLPKEAKDKIDDWLADHGYRIAPVTMENSDWMFAEPYDDAIARHDEARKARIKAAYLAYTAQVIPWYQKAAHQLLGRGMSYVFLLHVTRLNADSFEELAALLKQNHLHPVTLGKAMKDPAYKIPDPYVGPDGIEWLERWSLALKKDLPWDDFKDPPEWIQTEYNQVDSDHR